MTPEEESKRAGRERPRRTAPRSEAKTMYKATANTFENVVTIAVVSCLPILALCCCLVGFRRCWGPRFYDCTKQCGPSFGQSCSCSWFGRSRAKGVVVAPVAPAGATPVIVAEKPLPDLARTPLRWSARKRDQNRLSGVSLPCILTCGFCCYTQVPRLSASYALVSSTPASTDNENTSVVLTTAQLGYRDAVPLLAF